MRELLAKLFHGFISRREFAHRVLGLGFSVAAVDSILDTVALGLDTKKPGETFRVKPFSETTPYEQWMANEGVPIHTGYGVSDLRALEVKPWPRLGVRGALIDLQGAEGTDGAYLCELAPGAGTRPQRYLFEEVVYILDGEGETAVWNEGG